MTGFCSCKVTCYGEGEGVNAGLDFGAKGEI